MILYQFEFRIISGIKGLRLHGVHIRLARTIPPTAFLFIGIIAPVTLAQTDRFLLVVSKPTFGAPRPMIWILQPKQMVALKFCLIHASLLD
jgi:hypothetical protein